jgi:hypothetical protein
MKIADIELLFESSKDLQESTKISLFEFALGYKAQKGYKP